MYNPKLLDSCKTQPSCLRLVVLSMWHTWTSETAHCAVLQLAEFFLYDQCFKVDCVSVILFQYVLLV